MPTDADPRQLPQMLEDGFTRPGRDDMTLNSPATSVPGPPTRRTLIDRISSFPQVVRFEQARGLLLLAVFAGPYGLFVVGFFKVAHWVIGLSATLSASGLPPWLALLLDVGLLWLMYKLFFRRFRRTAGTLATFLGVRANPFGSLSTKEPVALLERGVPFGLYLRSFFDDIGLVPISRQELSNAFSTLDIEFIAVENARTTYRPDPLVVLVVPNSAWPETVLGLMSLASVIVVDANVGILHWLGDISDHMGFAEREAEVSRRAGMTRELETILARGFADKTVVFVPPGWLGELNNGNVAHQITTEEAAALERHFEIVNARAKRATPEEIANVEWFTRTRIKRALPRFGHVASSVDEVVRLVQQLGMGPR